LVRLVLLSVQAISATGFAATAAFGGVPVAVPSGVSSVAVEGSVPVAVPFGRAATFAVGSTAYAVPFGTNAPAAIGGVPVAIPGGFTGTAAFGAPTVTSGAQPLTINATGFTATAAFGVLPVAIPAGAASSITFGAPTLTVGGVAAVAAVAPQTAGLGLSALLQLGWDELLEKWEHLQRRERLLKKKRKREEERVAKKLANAQRKLSQIRDESVIDFSEYRRRLDDMQAALFKIEAQQIVDEERRALEEARYRAAAFAKLRNAYAEAAAQNAEAADWLERAIEAELLYDDEEAILALM
jgi:hypothetical protein